MAVAVELPHLTFKLLDAVSSLKHAVVQRNGGVSLPPYDALNVSYFVGDNPSFVDENRRRLLEAFCLPQYFIPFLEHGDKVAIVTKNTVEVVADAVLTTEKDLALMMTHADCQTIFLHDADKGVIGLVHVGWRGNVNSIIQKTIAVMECSFRSNPKNIVACISPSLGPKKAEFIHFSTEFPSSFLSFQISPNYFDLWSLSQWQLEESGLQRKNIEIAKICTYENEESFFSYRRDKITGRNASFIMLNN